MSKRNQLLSGLLALASTAIIFHSCGKSSNTAVPSTATASPAPTAAQLLTGGPWNVSKVAFGNVTTQMFETVDTPDSLKGLVYTFNANGTFTETGPRNLSGTWAFTTQANTVTITIPLPATRASWTYAVTATTLELGNNAVVTYVNPKNTLQYYMGEELYFTH